MLIFGVEVFLVVRGNAALDAFCRLCKAFWVYVSAHACASSGRQTTEGDYIIIDRVLLIIDILV